MCCSIKFESERPRNESLTIEIDLSIHSSTEFMHRSKWLGGFKDPVSQEPIYSKDKLKEIMEGLGFEKIHEEQMPLVIREHARKYQYIISEATGWRKN